MLKTREVAKRLGVTRMTVNNLIKRKELPARRIGGNWYVEEKEFEEYLKRTLTFSLLGENQGG